MLTPNPDYILIDHTADLGVKVLGRGLPDLFRKAGKALTHLMIKEITAINTTPLNIDQSGNDLEDIMVRWLGEILYLFQGEGLITVSIDVSKVTETSLKSVLETVPFDPKIHQVLNEIKAVTYHQIKVKKKGNLWEARVIFDL